MRAILVAIILIGLSGVSYGKESNHDTFLQLNLTHTFYTLFFAQYFNEGDQAYRPIYMAHKQYILTFLKQWEEAIKSEQYQSTKEIFETISRSNGYLGKYYSVWYDLHEPNRAHKLNLGEGRNGVLLAIYQSEGEYPDLVERIGRILDIVNLGILGSSRDYHMAHLIASPFENSEHEHIQRKAKGIIESTPLHKGVSLLALARNLIGGHRLLLHPGLNNWSSYRHLVSTGQGLINATATGAASLAMRFGGAVSRAARAVNPIIKKYPLATWLGISAGAHYGMFATAKASGSQPDKSSSPGWTGDTIPFSMAVLWEHAQALRPSISDIPNTDFKPQFQPKTKEQLVTQIKAHLDNPDQNPVNYLEVFVQAEKLKGLDRRDPSDIFAADFMLGQAQQAIDMMKNSDLPRHPTIYDLAPVRELIINGYLSRYARDYPNLTSLLLGWGGNCVSETMFLGGVLTQLDGFSGGKLGIALPPKHIEPVLWDGDRVTFLVSGKKTHKILFNIYKPQYLLLLVLRDLGADEGYNSEDMLLFERNDFTSKPKDKGLWESIKGTFYGVLEKVNAAAVREGVLEVINWQEMNVTAEEVSAVGEVPEFATVRYSDYHEAYDENPGLREVLIQNTSSADGGGEGHRLPIIYLPGQAEGFINFKFLGPVDHPLRSTGIEVYSAKLFYELKKMDTIDLQETMKNISSLALSNIMTNGEFSLFFENYESWIGYMDPHMQKLIGYNSFMRELPEHIGRLGWSICSPSINSYGQKLQESQEGFYEWVIKSPKDFLRLYDAVDTTTRSFFLTHFFLKKPICGNEGKSGYLQSVALSTIEAYLTDLDEISIEHSVKPIVISLSNGGLSFGPFGDKTKPFDRNSKEGEQNQKSSSAVKSFQPAQDEEDPKKEKETNKTILKDTTLLELTLNLGVGLHLWDDKLVTRFLNQEFTDVTSEAKAMRERLELNILSTPKNQLTPAMERLQKNL